MTLPTRVSLIIETYNLAEGTARERFAAAIQSASVAAAQCQGELLITDVCGDSDVAQIVAESAPGARLLDATGMSYDQAKMMAAKQARSEKLVYLDGDCEPMGDWPNELLDALQRHPHMAGIGGFTRYRGNGVISAAMSVMDFGFLYPVIERPLACYAFNNVAFRRQILIACPSEGEGMRCGCFAHAQTLIQRGIPVVLCPQAIAIHDLPPIFRERFRQGYDTIAACWANPRLPEARWLRLGIASMPLFLAMRILLDWRRLLIGHQNLGLGPAGLVTAFSLVPLLRFIDVMGMLQALLIGQRSG